MEHGRIRVLHVFGRMNRGGAEMRTLELMNAADRNRLKLEFLSLSGLPGDLDEEIAALGGTTHLCKLDVTFPVRFIQLLRREQFDVVQSHVHFPSGLILLLARAAGVKTRITHFRTTRDDSSTSLFRRCRDTLLKWLIDRNATHILAVSEGSMVEPWGHDWKSDPRCSVIYNAVDPMPYVDAADRAGVRNEFGFPLDARIVIHVGRMDPQKNHRRLISIFGEMAKLDAAICLLSVGRTADPAYTELKRQIADAGLEHRVVFAGLRDDVPRLLKAADLLLFPSLWEGLPGAVLEARAAGLPVVGSDLSGIREIQDQLQGVAILSLEDPDDAWARAGLSAIEKHVSVDHPFPLQGTAFDMAVAVRANEEVWDSK